MNVIILAGGFAERLWPLTREYPKTLLVLGGKPVLRHLLDNVAGIRDLESVTIAVDEQKSEFFEEKTDELRLRGNVPMRITHHAANDDGSIAGPLQKIAELLVDGWFEDRGADYLLVGGDNVFGFALEAVCGRYRSNDRTDTIAVQRVLEAMDTSQFGVPTLDSSGRVRQFEEKPEDSRTRNVVRLVSTACYVLRRETIVEVVDYLDRGEPDVLGRFVHSLVQRRHPLLAHEFTEPWFDIGTREGLLGANRHVLASITRSPQLFLAKDTALEHPVVVEADCSIRRSCLGPGAYIGRNVTIEDSEIVNSVVYDDCTIRRSRLKNCIVGEGSMIEGDVAEAVLGPRTQFQADGL